MRKKFIAVLLSVVMVVGLMVIPTGKTVIAEAAEVSQADSLVKIALAEEGYKESGNNYTKYNKWYYGEDRSAPWCAIFVSWCADQAGISRSIIKKQAGAGGMTSSTNTGKFGGKFYAKGDATPKVGDLVYYCYNRTGKSQHVEIVYEVNTKSKTFSSIGGNTGGSTDRVYKHKNKSFTHKDVVGFERPNYNDEVKTNDNRDTSNPTSAVSIQNGVYTLAPKCAPTRRLDVKSASTEKKANIQIYQNNGTLAQQFELVDVGDGYYSIIAKVSGLCVDVQSGKKESGTNVWQYTPNSTDAQKWKFEDAGDGYYYIVSKLDNGLCLDVYREKDENKTNVQIYRKKQNDAQKWKLIPVS